MRRTLPSAKWTVSLPATSTSRADDAVAMSVLRRHRAEALRFAIGVSSHVTPVIEAVNIAYATSARCQPRSSSAPPPANFRSVNQLFTPGTPSRRYQLAPMSNGPGPMLSTSRRTSARNTADIAVMSTASEDICSIAESYSAMARQEGFSSKSEQPRRAASLARWQGVWLGVPTITMSIGGPRNPQCWTGGPAPRPPRPGRSAPLLGPPDAERDGVPRPLDSPSHIPAGQHAGGVESSPAHSRHKVSHELPHELDGWELRQQSLVCYPQLPGGNILGLRAHAGHFVNIQIRPRSGLERSWSGRRGGKSTQAARPAILSNSTRRSCCSELNDSSRVNKCTNGCVPRGMRLGSKSRLATVESVDCS